MGMKLVVLVVIVLAVIAVAQIMRVYELSSKIRGKREEDIDLKVNNINASLMLIFLIVFVGSLFYMMYEYGNGMLPKPASKLGESIDWLFDLNWIIIITVFVITNALLFGFAWKYAYDPKRKAHWFPHDNKLEMLWTVVPAGVLAVIIILGLMTWNDITGEPSDDAVVVELYAKQFDWTARYSGDDNKLGFADYKLIGSTQDAESGDSYNNTLGLVTDNSIMWRVQGINDEIAAIHSNLESEKEGLLAMSVANYHKNIAKVEKLERIRDRILDMFDHFGDSTDSYSADDYTAKELVLIKDQEYFFVLRSQDVLHSAYFPHFRAQMNCVPGSRTTLKVTPTITTQEMRDDIGNQDFNYILMCNKICGVSHSNMKMAVTVVADTVEFNSWKNEEGSTNPALDMLHMAPEGVDTARMVMPTISNHGDHEDGHEDGDGEDHGDEAHVEDHH
jgi:cytochrome c oxidase subunit 2